MTDLSDLLGGLSKKDKGSDSDKQDDDPLDFLGGFKKKVQTGKLSTRKKAR